MLSYHRSLLGFRCPSVVHPQTHYRRPPGSQSKYSSDFFRPLRWCGVGKSGHSIFLLGFVSAAAGLQHKLPANALSVRPGDCHFRPTRTRVLGDKALLRLMAGQHHICGLVSERNKSLICRGIIPPLNSFSVGKLDDDRV